MGETDGSSSQSQRRTPELIDLKVEKAYTAADNVDDGVHRSYFVEVNLLNGRTMNLSLGFSEPGENGYRFLLDPFIQVTGFDEISDGTKTPTVVIRVGAFIAGNHDLQIGSRETFSFDPICSQFKPLQL
jgi:hypothetical protein